MKQYVVKKPKLFELIDKLAQEQTVVAPVKQENLANFQPIKSSTEILWGPPQTVLPPKKYFTPTTEDIVAYERDENGLVLKPLNEVKELVLFGVHPCDLNTINQMDKVFAEKNADENYLAKRRAATIIGVDCLQLCAPEAICLRMNGLDPKGRFDLFLTDLGDVFLAEAATEKGEGLVKGVSQIAGEGLEEKVKLLRKQRDKLFDKQEKKLLPDYKDLPKLMKANYDHPVWAERGKLCYSCGSCNMVCPTCYCFDVQDYMKVNLESGVRTRSWDGCMLGDFAKIASGENFRDERGERLRHRTNRKLNYLNEKWGESFCTGCGRCIKACLTKIVSPLEIANEIFERQKS